MLQEARVPTKAPLKSENKIFVQTTLYDLIETVNETVKLEETQLAAEIVMDLLDSCHARFQNTSY